MGALTGVPATPATPEPTIAAVEEPEAPPPITVAVDIRPWGVVTINGIRRGASPPLRSLDLAPGTYRVTVTNPGAPSYRTRRTVRPGGLPPVISHQF